MKEKERGEVEEEVWREREEERKREEGDEERTVPLSVTGGSFRKGEIVCDPLL